VWLAAEQVQLVEMDADYWKTWVHQRLVTPLGLPGAMTLYKAPAQDHLSLASNSRQRSRPRSSWRARGW
jgi:hypothetical protein